MPHSRTQRETLVFTLPALQPCGSLSLCCPPSTPTDHPGVCRAHVLEVVDSSVIMHSACPVRKKQRGTPRERAALTHECCTAPLRQVGTSTRTYMHTYIHADIHANIHTCEHTYIHADIHTYIRTYIHSYIRTFVHSYIRTFVHSYIRTFVHSYIRTYLHTYIRTFEQAHCRTAERSARRACSHKSTCLHCRHVDLSLSLRKRVHPQGVLQPHIPLCVVGRNTVYGYDSSTR